MAFIGPTFADCRDTMVEGESGLLSVLPPSALRGGSIADSWNRSLGEVHLSNGSRVKCFSSAEPERLRGPQHHRIWADELGAWRYEATWDMAMFGLRLGQQPQVVVTTTPRPTPLMRKIIGMPNVYLTRGSTYDNLANLAPTVKQTILERYEGTRLGRQELYGELLTDVPGSLWTAALLDGFRVASAPSLVRVIVAVDPAITSHADSDETGIIVVGKDAAGHGYVLADRTGRYSPANWARAAIAAYEEFNADLLVAEKNQGGDMVEQTVRTISPAIAYKGINAQRGKYLRAQPIAAAYEQGRVHHVGPFDELEDQMTNWLPDSGYSPDRLDALVHGLTELGFTWGGATDRFFAALMTDCRHCGAPNSNDAVMCLGCRQPLPPPTL